MRKLCHFLPSAFCFLLSGFCLLWSANFKLYLTDGTSQLVREYKVEGDRVRFYSIDRDDWEEVPITLVDLKKTEAEIKAREDSVRQDATAEAAEEKAERDARREVQRVPQEPGVYLIEERQADHAEAGRIQSRQQQRPQRAQGHQSGSVD